ncbi:HNH endonuclease [Burkholderia pseudomultivorans]|uniref:HNH endonuclease n=1 Tax=Burkholderia pseudomultivorans TaxID=1207504 RepID=UPI0018C71502|nr:HNH endonuclease [Burkholderia pseudomultivorans]
MGAKLVFAINTLKILSAERRIKTLAPDDFLMSEYENEVGFSFSDEYRFFLKEASTIFFGVIEPLVIVGERSGRCELKSEIQRVSHPDGYVWHHVENVKTMFLIPQDLHNAVRHTGGAAVLQPPGD